MASLEQSIELYKLMHDRCKASGFCKNQEQVYLEMIDFIGNCDSVEDSMEKIRSSKYYLAPSVAIVKDKLEAWKRAAIENEMSELVDVYSKKIEEIENNEQEIYTTGYEQTAQNIKNDYLSTMQAFTNIFVFYISYLCSDDDIHIEDMKKAKNDFKRPSNNFNELSKIDKFRKLIPLNDDAYYKFVSDVDKILNEDSASTFLENFDVGIDSDFQDIQNYKDDIINAGKNDNWNVNYEKVKVTSPDYENHSDISELKYKFEEQV